MTDETKKPEPKNKNRVAVNVSAMSVDVESSKESLDKVADTADEFMQRIIAGLKADGSKEDRIRKVGIQ